MEYKYCVYGTKHPYNQLLHSYNHVIRFYLMKAFSEEFGQDERSLVKLPFTVLGRSDKRKITKEIRSEWEGRDENNQRKKFWKSVTASGKHGLPEYPAEELYIALLYFSTHAGFSERTIKVVPYEVLKLMRWGTDGRAYRRLRRSLSQLAGVLIETNALFDTGTQSFIEAGFHIVDNYEFKKKTKGSGGRKDVLEVTWNKRLFEHFQLGRFKHLNVSFFYSLSSPLSKRLYRWLDESIYPSGRIEIDVRHLAHTRLEMSRSVWYVSSIMQRLRPALNELQDTGVCNWSLVASKTTDSKRKLVFTKPDSTSRKPVQRIAKRKGGRAPIIVTIPKSESNFNLDEEMKKLSFEEARDIEKEAVSMLDEFNKARYREEGRGAMSTWIMVRNNMAAIVDRKRKDK